MRDGDLNDSMSSSVLQKSYARISRKPNTEKHKRDYGCTYSIRKGQMIGNVGLYKIIYRVCNCGLYKDKSKFKYEESLDEIENGALEIHFNSYCHYREYETECRDRVIFEKVCHCPKEEIHNNNKESGCILL